MSVGRSGVVGEEKVKLRIYKSMSMLMLEGSREDQSMQPTDTTVGSPQNRLQIRSREISVSRVVKEENAVRLLTSIRPMTMTVTKSCRVIETVREKKSLPCHCQQCS